MISICYLSCINSPILFYWSIYTWIILYYVLSMYYIYFYTYFYSKCRFSFLVITLKFGKFYFYFYEYIFGSFVITYGMKIERYTLTLDTIQFQLYQRLGLLVRCYLSFHFKVVDIIYLHHSQKSFSMY